jgi:hypothetical protein
MSAGLRPTNPFTSSFILKSISFSLRIFDFKMKEMWGWYGPEGNAGLNDEISSSLETTDNRSNFFQLMIAAVVQVSKLVWKLKTLRLSVAPARPSIRIIPGVAAHWS